MNTSEQLNDLAAALSKAQGEFKVAKKDSENPFFSKGEKKSTYADLASIVDACRASLAAHGLAVVQGVSCMEQKVTVTSRLLHSSGQWIESDVTVTAKDSGSQAIGSAITYGRRYGFAALVGVVAAEEDDDGERSEGRSTEVKKKNSAPYRSAAVANILKLLAEAGYTEQSSMKKKVDDMLGPGYTGDDALPWGPVQLSSMEAALTLEIARKKGAK